MVYLVYALQYIGGELSGEMLLGIVEHGGTNAVLAAGTLEHIYIDAALAAAPESLVVGEVGKCTRLIAQLRVHGHHSGTARQTAYLGMGPAGACQGECKILDALGQAQVAESRVYDETRGGNVGFVAPGLYVAEPGKPVAREGY